MNKLPEGNYKKNATLGLKNAQGSKWTAGSDRTPSEMSEDEKVKAPVSPLAWLCDFSSSNTRKTPPASKLTSATRSLDSREARETRETQASRKLDPRNSSAFHSFFAESDEEMNNAPNASDDTGMQNLPYSPANQQQVSLFAGQRGSNAPAGSLTLRHLPPPASTMQGEARIVAPNVSKLSPQSAVEIRLQSNSESVAVLCAVDVLKMRSTFFHDLLLEQERSSALVHNEKSALNMLSGNIMWREAIVIPEPSPFEAAAFLESLHEGRALFRGEWSLCWARLSVTWVVEELIAEFAGQIEAHMDRIVSVITTQHWRTNPNVLLGMRVAVFRKSTNLMPTVVTGMAVEAGNAIGHSKLRIAFEAENGLKSAPALLNMVSSPMQPSAPTSLGSGMNLMGGRTRSSSSAALSLRALSLQGAGDGNTESLPPRSFPSNAPSPLPSAFEAAQHVVGDISEPFWIQSTSLDCSPWEDPDEHSYAQVQQSLSPNDLKVFWEMVRALVELPELSMACKRGVRSPEDVVAMLKKVEYRVLWQQAESVEIVTLTKDMAADLLKHIYIAPSAGMTMSSNGNGNAQQGAY